MGVQALVGKRKASLLLSRDPDRVSWQVDGPMLEGWGVFRATVDARDGTMFAATNHTVCGPTVQRSHDGGRVRRCR